MTDLLRKREHYKTECRQEVIDVMILLANAGGLQEFHIRVNDKYRSVLRNALLHHFEAPLNLKIPIRREQPQ